jgi:hypothetical protein
MHRPAADRTRDLNARIGRVVGFKVFLKQTPGQRVAQFAGALFSLGESNQAILAIAAEHLIESLARFLQKLSATHTQFLVCDSWHGRSSLIEISLEFHSHAFYRLFGARSDGHAPTKLTRLPLPVDYDLLSLRAYGISQGSDV